MLPVAGFVTTCPAQINGVCCEALGKPVLPHPAVHLIPSLALGGYARQILVLDIIIKIIARSAQFRSLCLLKLNPVAVARDGTELPREKSV